ncbi:MULTISPECIES: EthD family reductase [unclassified Caulobacter]|uniref:EthD family reductase n=1 Tax=unclassified Caulobacter TaxID=2648921 RepID=UPI000D3AF31D|nr:MULTISPECIES: EthD family reductase [unclassified Caulobacter]PTS88201.1 EthD family reductase [Caulobacter sp. HMWF009]PTT09632.1 EthD family reductase [Caulobacter sp. HMWF025]PTT76292.1 EthD family reductase [Pseudomonas sp. HMWF010]
MSILTVIYPAAPGARFDLDYYVAHHTPLVKEVLSPVEVVIRQGVGDPAGGPPPFVLIADIVFADGAAMAAAMGSPRMGEVVADVAQFTDIQLVTQISRPVG